MLRRAGSVLTVVVAALASVAPVVATGDASIGSRPAPDCHLAQHPVGAVEGTRLAREGSPLPLVRPRSYCHEGYVHGMQVAWLEHAPTRVLVASGARSCDASDSQVDWACGHSLGHVLGGRAGSMATAMRWCDRAYGGAVHLGLDRDGFLTTCAKGAIMELTLRDDRAGTTDRAAHDCRGVDERLLPWCEGHLWLRADLGIDRAATPAEQLQACDQLARTAAGRAACRGMVGRAVDDPRVAPPS